MQANRKSSPERDQLMKIYTELKAEVEEIESKKKHMEECSVSRVQEAFARDRIFLKE